MNIANQGEKVGLFLTDDRLIAILEKVSSTFVATIEVLCIPGELLAHDRRYSVFAAFKQKMHMIGHEDPCIDFAASERDIFGEPLKESILVLIVFKDSSFVYSTDYDVV